MAQDREKMLTGHRQRHSETTTGPAAPDADTGMSAEEIAEMRELTGHDFPTRPQPGRKRPETSANTEYQARRRGQEYGPGERGIGR